MSARATGRALISQRLADGSARVYAGFHRERGWAAAHGLGSTGGVLDDPAAARAVLLDAFGDAAPSCGSSSSAATTGSSTGHWRCCRSGTGGSRPRASP